MSKWWDTINRLLHRNAVKNGAWMYVMQIFNTIIPLFTLPYITRVLGASQYGVFAIAINLIGYLQVLVEYGFGMSATRDVALTGSDSTRVSIIFSNVFYSRVILYAASAIVAAIYMIIMRQDPTLCKCVLALLLCLFGYVVQENWLFQGMQDMKYISIVNIIGRLISVILIFAIVKTPQDIILYSILYSVSPFLSGMIGFIIALLKYHVKLVKPVKTDIFSEMKSGFYVFTTSLSSIVFGAIGVTFLGILASNETAGCYSAIQKIPNIIMLAWAPISQVMYPISSKRMQASWREGKKFVNKVRSYILPVFALGALIIAVFSNPIVSIAFGDEYSNNSFWLIPLLAWMLLGINNNFWGIQTLLASGHDKEYSKCFQIGVACTVILNFVLIYFAKGTGAAFAPAVSEGIISLLLYKQIRKIAIE